MLNLDEGRYFIKAFQVLIFSSFENLKIYHHFIYEDEDTLQKDRRQEEKQTPFLPKATKLRFSLNS